jgi:hypothetical protein
MKLYPGDNSINLAARIYLIAELGTGKFKNQSLLITNEIIIAYCMQEGRYPIGL